ncbi:LEPR-XLL domain-containing protein, partial [Mangrovicoccus sp. HB161399]|uniref:LEPR-XLL domain-containing protein n=1 Tax=Mangrovicoccus sp. HB161399 TaxID=2720392 RepID=UPI001553FE77
MSAQSAPPDQPDAGIPLARSEKFSVEALEPRILLSADPVSYELARILERSDPGADLAAQAAIVEQLDAETAQLLSEESPPSEVLWPGDWDRPETTSGTLGEAELDSLAAAALETWAASLGVEADMLPDFSFGLADLPDGQLGWAEGLTVLLDGSRGDWFADATPYEHSEYLVTAEPGVLAAVSPEAAAGYDALTVVMHEIGHGLGLGDGSGTALMDGALAKGQRLLPSASGLQDGWAAPVSGALTAADVFSGGVLNLSAVAAAGPAPAGLTITVTSMAGAVAEVTVSGAAAADAGVNDSYSGVTEIIGRSDLLSVDTLVAPQQGNDWTITGLNEGTLNGMAFSDVERAEGGALRDSFRQSGPGFLSGGLDDGTGTGEFVLQDFVSVSGDLSFGTGSGRSLTLDDAATVSAEYTEFSVTGGRVFIGDLDGNYILDDNGTAGVLGDDTLATGIAGLAASGDLAMALHRAGSETWVTAAGSGISASLEGVDGVAGSVTALSFTLNADSGAGRAIDFSATAGTAISDTTITTAETEVTGTIALSFGSAAIAEGTMSLSVTGRSGIADPSGGADLSGELTALSLSGMDLFAGTGGSAAAIADANPFSALEAASATGFLLTGAEGAIAVFDADDGRVFTGAEIGAASAEVLGISSVDILISQLSAAVNAVGDPLAAGSGERMDWSGFDFTGTALESAPLSLTSADATRIGGALTVSTTDAIYVDAGFSLATQSASGDAGGSTVSGDLLVLTLEIDQAFAGTGAVADGTQLILSDETGFLAEGGSLTLAVLDAGTDTYTGVSGALSLFDARGFDGVTFTLADLELGLNLSSTGTLLDWSTVSGGAVVSLDDSQPVVIRGAAEVAFGGALLLSGGFSASVTEGYIADAGTGTLFSLDLTGASAFAGAGGTLAALADPDPAGALEAAGAQGVFADTLSVALRLLETAGGSYQGVAASLGGAGIVGVNAVAMTVSGATLRANSSTTGTRVNWDGTGDVFALAGVTADRRLEVDATVGIAAGDAAFFSGTARIAVSDVTALDLSAQGQGSVTGGLLTVSASGGSAFFGSGASLSGTAIATTGGTGVSVTGASLDLAILNESGGTRSWTGLAAGIDGAALENLPDVDLSLSSASALRNAASGAGAAKLSGADWASV